MTVAALGWVVRVGLVGCALWSLPGVRLVLEDAGASGEMYDGLGAALGALVAAPAVLAAALLWLALRRLRRQRPRAAAWACLGAAALAGVGGAWLWRLFPAEPGWFYALCGLVVGWGTAGAVVAGLVLLRRTSPGMLGR